MSVGGQTGKSALRSQAEDLIKQHLVYDGSNRVTDIYTASAIPPQTGPNGAPCTHVTYQYSGATTLVTGMKEALATWDSTWDF